MKNSLKSAAQFLLNFAENKAYTGAVLCIYPNGNKTMSSTVVTAKNPDLAKEKLLAKIYEDAPYLEEHGSVTVDLHEVPMKEVLEGLIE